MAVLFRNRKSVLEQFVIPTSSRCFELDSGKTDYQTSVVSILQNGFVITSPRKLRKGCLLSINLRFPAEPPESAFWEKRCSARVVAEQPVDSGTLAYHIEIEGSPLPA